MQKVQAPAALKREPRRFFANAPKARDKAGKVGMLVL